MTTSTSPGSSTRDTGRALVIEVWTDLGCPWCYLGKHRLEQAITTAAVGQVRVVLRSFQLDPDMAATPVPVPEVFVAKHGGTTEHARQMESQMAELAKAEGLPYSLDRPAANTFDVHRVLHLARTHGVATPMFSTLQRGYFAGLVNPFDQDVLIQVAADAGVPAQETRAVLSGDAYAQAVRAERATGAALGITGVPFAVFNGTHAVAGATSVRGYAAAIAQTLGVSA
ncbi:DsbA family oxidoreductase [Phytohabitans rumicis]|uniref:DSBA oxidoreductase n=1 Tax=Phytohabitans rumicis TaxID=1076125 RepID=A0A6V8LCQ0_9ACTN|nr:DsbA family oxidoreductase [Phytohabitans rumicis]GFJ93450.1 DSBA oxidoreductase [Phytohabitans rumicis]